MTEDKAINHDKIPLKIGNGRKSGVFIAERFTRRKVSKTWSRVTRIKKSCRKPVRFNRLIYSGLEFYYTPDRFDPAEMKSQKFPSPFVQSIMIRGFSEVGREIGCSVEYLCLAGEIVGETAVYSTEWSYAFTGEVQRCSNREDDQINTRKADDRFK